MRVLLEIVLVLAGWALISYTLIKIATGIAKKQFDRETKRETERREKIYADLRANDLNTTYSFDSGSKFTVGTPFLLSSEVLTFVGMVQTTNFDIIKECFVSHTIVDSYYISSIQHYVALVLKADDGVSYAIDISLFSTLKRADYPQDCI